MASTDKPTAGYLVEAKQLIQLLPHEVQDEYDQYVADLDSEDAAQLIDKHWPATAAKPAELFVFAPEDTSEELEEGVMYARFDESDLYLKTPSRKARQLERMGVKMPSFYMWNTWG